jgi:hypothetical protein
MLCKYKEAYLNEVQCKVTNIVVATIAMKYRLVLPSPSGRTRPWSLISL